MARVLCHFKGALAAFEQPRQIASANEVARLPEDLTTLLTGDLVLPISGLSEGYEKKYGQKIQHRHFGFDTLLRLLQSSLLSHLLEVKKQGTHVSVQLRRGAASEHANPRRTPTAPPSKGSVQDSEKASNTGYAGRNPRGKRPRSAAYTASQQYWGGSPEHVAASWKPTATWWSWGLCRR